MKYGIIYIAIIYSVTVMNILKFVVESNADARSMFRSSWLLAPAIGYLFSVKSVLKVRYIYINKAILLFIIYIFLHAIIIGYNGGISIVLISFFSWGAWLGLFIYLSNEDTTKDWFVFLFSIFVIIGLAQSITVIFESTLSNPLFKAATTSGVIRHYGLGQSISVTGIQVGTGLIASLYFAKTKDSSTKIFMYLAFVVNFIGLFLVAGRGPIIYTILALLFVVSKLYKKNIIKLLGVLLITTMIYVFIDHYYMDEVYKEFITSALSFEDKSNQGRFNVYIAAFEILFSSFSNAIFGTGSGTSAIIPNVTGSSSFTNESSIIKLFFELGIFGGMLFLFTIVSIYREIYLFLKNTNSYKAIFGISILILITLELLMHDMIMAFLISFSYWSLLGVLLHEKKKYKINV